MSSAAARPDYDVVVIGAGLGGLSAAAALARAGRSVLVVEAQEGSGGYAHAFRRGAYRFDPAVHVTGLAHPGQLLHEYLSVLGAGPVVRFLPLREFYGLDFPGLQMSVPHGAEAFVAAHARQWPEERAGIQAFVALCLRVASESQQLGARTSWRDLDLAMRSYPALFQHRMATVGQVLDTFVGDGRLKATLAGSWPYLGVPPARLAFTGFCSMLASMIDRGPAYCQGGFQSLADGLAGVVRAAGGRLVFGSRVTRVLVHDGRAGGVELEDGERVSSATVVSNADAWQTLRDLVGEDHLATGYLRRLRRLVPAWSAFVLFAATTMDMTRHGLAHETFLYDGWDHARAEAAVRAGAPGGMWLSVPSLVDPAMAPPGQHTLVFSTLARYDAPVPWPALKESFQEVMLARLDRLLPGLRQSLTFLDSATPQTLARYTSNHQGAIYGWENTPAQSQPKRLRAATPLPGLFLAGHWTEPGSGSLRAIVSGMQAAAAVLGAAGPEDLFGRLQGAPAAAR